MSGGTPEIALTIAGSDSGGAAGLQADLKAFAALGVYGASAVTAVTAQNTVGVQAVHVVPTDLVDAQITSVVTDLGPAAVKTGMLATAATVRAVAARAARGDLPRLVVDPVMVATTGRRLLDPRAERAYLELLFPHALVVTPNLREASVLVGRELTTVDDMICAAGELADTGARHVVVKGGHLRDGEAADVVYDGDRTTVLSAERVATENVHGTGCTLSAAIAAQLARGAGPMEAIRRAKDFVSGALRGAAGWTLGAGQGPVDAMGWGAAGTFGQEDEVRWRANADRPG